jgi:hypothetical protein
MGSALFGKYKILLRTVCNMCVQLKLRAVDRAVGYGWTKFKSSDEYEYTENCGVGLQSVWITADRYSCYIKFLVLFIYHLCLCNKITHFKSPVAYFHIGFIVFLTHGNKNSVFFNLVGTDDDWYLFSWMSLLDSIYFYINLIVHLKPSFGDVMI